MSTADGVNLQLKKFQPQNMADDATAIFVARRRSGKSVAVRDIMYYKKHIRVAIVCNGTEEGNSFYGASCLICSYTETTTKTRSIA